MNILHNEGYAECCVSIIGARLVFYVLFY